ncbi:oxidoreductase [Algiphilus sp.]|uniref:oxidoreductase n=1 Tax=Algiphilus sp. TaxID=1872431 RepID=UPI003B516548
MKRWTVADIPDQSGKLVVVTGANIGLGFETAKALAEKGAKVVLACRNLDKARAAASQIAGETDVRQLDVSDLESVRRFAAELKADYPCIDLLINNAGVMACPQAASAQGFELQWATNHLGHFLLTGLLLDQLEAAPAARVVALSSIAHRDGRFHWDDLQHRENYRAMRVYCQSKLANLVFALELDRRLKEKGSSVMSLAAHPGVANTNLGYAGPGFAQSLPGRALVWLVGHLLHSAANGALPTLMAATQPDVKGGEYFGPQNNGPRGSKDKEWKGPPGPAVISERARNREDAKRLWTESERMVGMSYLNG